MGIAESQALYEGRAGKMEPIAADLNDDDILAVKLWQNPCWFSFRLNYLALNFNNPVYGTIESRHDLLRPEFVVLYSLSLKDNTTSTEIAGGSGFPKNTLSRAINKLLKLKLIRKETVPGDLRSFVLSLQPEGRDIVENSMQVMIQREKRMLEILSPAERLILSELLSKVVLDSRNWPSVIDSSESCTDDTI